MNWEEWFCANPSCDDWAWMVQRDLATPEVWRVAKHVDEHPFTVAATDPVCPHCGASLAILFELEGRADRPNGAVPSKRQRDYRAGADDTYRVPRPSRA
jgi:hypothetical protein